MGFALQEPTPGDGPRVSLSVTGTPVGGQPTLSGCKILYRSRCWAYGGEVGNCPLGNLTVCNSYPIFDIIGILIKICFCESRGRLWEQYGKERGVVLSLRTATTRGDSVPNPNYQNQRISLSPFVCPIRGPERKAAGAEQIIGAGPVHPLSATPQSMPESVCEGTRSTWGAAENMSTPTPVGWVGRIE